MPFTNVAQIGRAVQDDGDTHVSFIYKASIAATGVASRYVDTSMSSGIPKFNAYVGTQLAATVLTGQGNEGIYLGATPASGKSKHILTWGMRTTTATTPMVLTLCDYLMFYPLVDLDDVDVQTMENAVSLPRYASGEGVRMMLVSSVQSTATVTLTVNYINQAGAAKSVTTNVLAGTTNMLISAPSGTSSPTPFIGLAEGDSGVRSVTSVQLNNPAGGFANLVLVKPLLQLNLYELSTHSEITCVQDKTVLPRVYDGAYLNIISLNTGTVASALQGDLTFITR